MEVREVGLEAERGAIVHRVARRWVQPSLQLAGPGPHPRNLPPKTQYPRNHAPIHPIPSFLGELNLRDQVPQSPRLRAAPKRPTSEVDDCSDRVLVRLLLKNWKRLCKAKSRFGTLIT